MTFDDIGCSFGDRLSVIRSDGMKFDGVLVDFEMDFDGSYGGDSISVKLDDGITMSISEYEIDKIVTQ